MKKIAILFLFFYSVSEAQLELPYAVKNVNNRPIDHWFYNPATLAPWANTAAILASATRIEGQLYYVSGGEIYTFKGGILDGNLLPISSSGSGDMILASTQTNSGLKTFLDGTLGLRNVANTFTSQFTNTNTAARTYTLPDFSGNNFVLNNGLNSSLVTNSMVGNTRITGDGLIALSNFPTVGAFHSTLSIGLPPATTTLPLRALSLVGNITIGTSSASTMINVSPYVSLNASGRNYSSLNITGTISDEFSNTIIGINYNPTVTGTGVHYAAIFGTGRVGIGTISPTEVLEVAGNLKFSGALMPNDSSGTSRQVLTSQGSGSAPIWSNYYAPSTLVANATDANFTATLNGVHNILDGVASTNRVITIPTGSNGDLLKFYNTEDNFVWSFTGEPVYLANRVTVVTQLLFNVPCFIERIDGRWIITN